MPTPLVEPPTHSGSTWGRGSAARTRSHRYDAGNEHVSLLMKYIRCSTGCSGRPRISSAHSPAHLSITRHRRSPAGRLPVRLHQQVGAFLAAVSIHRSIPPTVDAQASADPVAGVKVDRSLVAPCRSVASRLTPGKTPQLFVLGLPDFGEGIVLGLPDFLDSCIVTGFQIVERESNHERAATARTWVKSHASPPIARCIASSRPPALVVPVPRGGRGRSYVLRLHRRRAARQRERTGREHDPLDALADALDRHGIGRRCVGARRLQGG